MSIKHLSQFIYFIRDGNLQIPGYNLYREDYPFNIRQGGVCIYYKIYPPLKIKNVHYFQECIPFKIKIKDKLRNQCQDNFE